SKGVRVYLGEQHINKKKTLNISYGYNIPETAAKVQESVKKAIENMIGFSVKNVHIKISGVVVSK
ncbi:MAG: Asp23/Gls24 family envelope stress response protein, partial [Lachnospiraceae bacterium]|nr:Asp23/Gls24 family envelope stress response protein [Lachnospiraceae bacterium]